MSQPPTPGANDPYQDPNATGADGRPMPPTFSGGSVPQVPSGSPQSSGAPGYGPQDPNAGYGSAAGANTGYGDGGTSGSGAQGYGVTDPNAGYGAAYGSGSGYGSPAAGSQGYGAQGYGSQGYGSQGYGAQSYGAGSGSPYAGAAAAPNAGTLPDQAYGPGSESYWMARPDEVSTAMWSHVGAIFFPLWVPLIMFLVKKDESRFVREHMRQALNFALLLMVVSLGASILLGIIALVTLGFGAILFLLLPIVSICALVFEIMAAMAANKGQGYKYPLNVNWVK